MNQKRFKVLWYTFLSLEKSNGAILNQKRNEPDSSLAGGFAELFCGSMLPNWKRRPGQILQGHGLYQQWQQTEHGWHG